MAVGWLRGDMVACLRVVDERIMRVFGNLGLEG